MKKKIGFWASAAAVITLLTCLPAAMAADNPTVNGNTATKIYHFESSTPDLLSYDAAQEMDVDGKTYQLTNISYEIKSHTEPVTVARLVQTTDTGSYDKEITETVSGREYRLTAQMPEWTESAGKTMVQEYASKSAAPQELTADGETYTLKNIVAGTKEEAISVPATFQTSNPASNIYEFGGQLVTLADSTPTWSGWQTAIATYLGLNGSTYQFTTGNWSGDFVAGDSGYTRTATYTGTRQTLVWTATYQTDTAYTAEVIYVDSANPNGVYSVDAIATYALVSNHSVLMTVLAVGGGVLVLAAVVSGIIMILKRKKNKQTEENEEVI